MSEKASWKIQFKVDKYEGDFKSEKEILGAGVKPFETVETEKNMLLNEGINEMWDLICGGSANAYNNANSYIGVGTGTAAATAGQTGLQGTTKTYKAMDTGYPTSGTSQKATWKSTYASGDGNHAWQEITVCNSNSDSGDNMNRKVQDMGTKSAGQTWVATVEITLS